MLTEILRKFQSLSMFYFLQCESMAVNRSIRSHAEDIVNRLNFDSFMEVSAKEGYQVEKLFQRAIDLVRN